MPQIEATPQFVLIRSVPHIEGDSADFVARLADEAEATLSSFVAQAAQIRADETLSDVGKRERLASLAETSRKTLNGAHKPVSDRLRLMSGELEANLLVPSRALRLPDGVDPEESRAAEREARDLFRRELEQDGGQLKVAARLLEAARAGDLETVRALAGGPAAFRLVDEDTLASAVEAYSEATQPQKFVRFKELRSALDLIEDNHQRAGEVLGRLSDKKLNGGLQNDAA